METIIKDKNLYFVGGVVRDEILGIPNFDIDLCYEGNAIEFAQQFNIIKNNVDFGTVRILFEDKEIDIASTRKETYPKKGHLPVVENIGCCLKEDLIRRDFTINAMAKNTLTGEIVDCFNGRNDLGNKVLRVLHDESFIDDPTRILRGLKFSVRFGFELDIHTQKLQEEYLNNVNYDMSYHRVKKELKETFNLNNEVGYDKFVNNNIYKLFGEDQVPHTLRQGISQLTNKYKPKNTWLIYVGAYDLSNFELNSEEKEIYTSFHKIKLQKPQSDIEIYNTFKNLPVEAIIMYAGFVDYEIAIRFLDFLMNIKIFTNGEDLIGLGIKQGLIFKEIFETLLLEKIKFSNLTKEDELQIVKDRYL